MSHYKNVVLVKPPEQSPFSFGAFSLGVLAAAVKDIADITVIDATHLSVEDTVQKIHALNPHLLGITLMGFLSVEAGVEIIKALKPCSFPVIAGGHGAALTPEPIIEAGADVVVFGEGEATFRDILENGISPGMPGTFLPDPGNQPNGLITLIKGPVRPLISPLDLLNDPLRDLMPPPENDIHLMETSRGCPHRCDFCETTRFMDTAGAPIPRNGSPTKSNGCWTIMTAG